MKRLSIFLSLCVCFFLLAACEKGEKMQELMPSLVKSSIIKLDFKQRYPLARIISYDGTLSSSPQISFKEDNGVGEAWYVDSKWNLTKLVVDPTVGVSEEVLNAFYNSEYGREEIIEIVKYEQEGINHGMYDFRFIHDGVDTHLYVSEKGLKLGEGYISHLYNDAWGVVLPHNLLDYIAERYSESEVYGCVVDSGSFHFFIYHDDRVKHVYFNLANGHYWEKTQYELNEKDVIPDEVYKEMKEREPNFKHTTVCYRESIAGDYYIFFDYKHPNKIGHFVRVD